jgi:hypothetical protein
MRTFSATKSTIATRVIIEEGIVSEGNMKSPSGIEVRIGQVWEEVDPRFLRHVTVREIGSILVSNEPSIEIEGPTGKLTKARLSRFNGKRGGYRLVKDVAPESESK